MRNDKASTPSPNSTSPPHATSRSTTIIPAEQHRRSDRLTRPGFRSAGRPRFRRRAGCKRTVELRATVAVEFGAQNHGGVARAERHWGRYAGPSSRDAIAVIGFVSARPFVPPGTREDSRQGGSAPRAEPSVTQRRSFDLVADEGCQPDIAVGQFA
jgi:hypothetical protein